MQSLCLGAEQLSVRINSLVCLGRMISVMDKWMVQDLMLPFLEKVPPREPGVLMAILGILHEVWRRRLVSRHSVWKWLLVFIHTPSHTISTTLLCVHMYTHLHM